MNRGLPAASSSLIVNGPQRRLVQWLPSPTVPAAARVNGGAGRALDSFVPGGVCQPGNCWLGSAMASGGTRDPLQYCDTIGFAVRVMFPILTAGISLELVSAE